MSPTGVPVSGYVAIINSGTVSLASTPSGVTIQLNEQSGATAATTLALNSTTLDASVSLISNDKNTYNANSPTIAVNLARLDRILRRQLAATFPGLGRDALDALELVTSWDAWNRLRAGQGCSVARVRGVVVELLRTVTEGNRAGEA